MAMTTPTSYAWLQDFLGNEKLSPEDIASALSGYAFEIEDVHSKEGDTVIDIDILPNRSSDCLCHRGIAREIATLTNTTLAYDPLQQKVDLPATEAIAVDIQDTDACRRFTATIIEGIEVKESPEWLQKRLQAIGQRPINNIVDATNYVMFALGQPLHAYDAEKFPQVDGVWQFVVRTAHEGEVVSLIAEKGKDEDRDVTLTGTELLIVDGSSNTPIGLAGVKGGRYAGVTESTTKVIIEAANFDPILTRKTARRLGIVIDASKRFENEPSRDLPPYGQNEIIALITKIAGGACTGYFDVYPTPVTQQAVTVSPERVNGLLGLSLTMQQMQEILQRAGIAVQEDGDSMVCIGPWERTDLNIEEDFIEEIGRIYGYSHIASVAPQQMPLAEINTRHFYSEKVREVLVSLGFSEVITSSFRKKDEIQLHNALASDKSYMRSSLIKNINETLDKNIGFTDLLGMQDVRVFEIGTVFSTQEGIVTEHVSLCLGIRLKQSGYSGKEDAVLDTVLKQLEESLGVSIQATKEKGVAEINFSGLLQQLPVPKQYEASEISDEIVYKPFSSYPSMSRDIALWVAESQSAEAVEEVLNAHAGDLRVRTTLFDEFSKDGKTSYAFRLVFQSPEKTLTDAEINAVMEDVYKAVAAKGWEVR